MSDDRRHAATVIGFVGSVFSPYYARARRRGNADPAEHCAVNVALYGENARRWAMTERPRSRLRQSKDALAIGPSTITWDGSALTLELSEWSVPVPRPIRGRIRLYPDALTEYRVALDPGGRHWWGPIAPSARVEVQFDEPSLRWSGTGYCDSNRGEAPLEDDFIAWNWSRSHHPGGTTIFYDVQPRHGADRAMSLRFDPSGTPSRSESPAQVALPRTAWRATRRVRLQSGDWQQVRTLEDTPFYTRSLITECHGRETQITVHESLSLDRFRAGWVQALLPFRMPRRPW